MDRLIMIFQVLKLLEMNFLLLPGELQTFVGFSFFWSSEK